MTTLSTEDGTAAVNTSGDANVSECPLNAWTYKVVSWNAWTKTWNSR